MKSHYKLLDHECLSCGSADWHENRQFSELAGVTSGSTPFAPGGRLCVCLQCGLIQKITDKKWKQEVYEIYSKSLLSG